MPAPLEFSRVGFSDRSVRMAPENVVHSCIFSADLDNPSPRQLSEDIGGKADCFLSKLTRSSGNSRNETDVGPRVCGVAINLDCRHDPIDRFNENANRHAHPFGTRSYLIHRVGPQRRARQCSQDDGHHRQQTAGQDGLEEGDKPMLAEDFRRGRRASRHDRGTRRGKQRSWCRQVSRSSSSSQRWKLRTKVCKTPLDCIGRRNPSGPQRCQVPTQTGVTR